MGCLPLLIIVSLIGKVIASQAAIPLEDIFESPFQKNYVLKWNLWKMIHHKKYDSENENLGFQAWVFNYDKIIDHNIRFIEGIEFYMQTFNKFADCMPDELKRMLLTPVPVAKFYRELNPTTLPSRESSNIPDNLNWALHGWTSTDHDSQLQRCNQIYPNGWAFSATEAVEAQIFNKTGTYTKLSKQEIVDCVESNSDRAHISLDAFSYIYRIGVTLEDFYPMGTTSKEICKKKLRQSVAKINECHLLKPEDEENLKVAVALIGPISVSIRVTRGFFYYASGVFYDPVCTYKEAQTNHAVLLVGYGLDPDAGEYWIIRNNWGKEWGENGFARMARNTFINCGIASAAVYPVI